MAISISELIGKAKYSVKFPKTDGLSQDKEWFLVDFGDEERKLRFHDYGEIFSIPGLYEYLYYEKLKCNSPKTVCSLLAEEMKKESEDPRKLRALDVGAGNGMVGEQLREIGAQCVIGFDIIEEAKRAVERDRPDVYDQYFVEDLTQLSQDTHLQLELENLNCLTTVAALGFGDIPPMAFTQAYNLIADGGWLAFNIKDLFISEKDRSGFCQLIHKMMENGIMEFRQEKRYQHRLSCCGEPLYYVAIVGRKLKDIPKSYLDDLK